MPTRLFPDKSAQRKQEKFTELFDRSMASTFPKDKAPPDAPGMSKEELATDEEAELAKMGEGVRETVRNAPETASDKANREKKASGNVLADYRQKAVDKAMDGKPPTATARGVSPAKKEAAATETDTVGPLAGGLAQEGEEKGIGEDILDSLMESLGTGEGAGKVVEGSDVAKSATTPPAPTGDKEDPAVRFPRAYAYWKQHGGAEGSAAGTGAAGFADWLAAKLPSILEYALPDAADLKRGARAVWDTGVSGVIPTPGALK